MPVICVPVATRWSGSMVSGSQDWLHVASTSRCALNWAGGIMAAAQGPRGAFHTYDLSTPAPAWRRHRLPIATYISGKHSMRRWQLLIYGQSSHPQWLCMSFACMLDQFLVLGGCTVASGMTLHMHLGTAC